MMCGKNLALWYCILPLIASSSVFWTNLTSDNEEKDSTIPYQVDHENDDQILDNIVPQMCDNITCIRLCCPFGNRLINGECITEQDKFIFLKYINGYVGNSLNNGSKGVGKSFLLVVHDPCPKTRHYLLNPYYITFLANGALYIPYYNAIIESTSYCFATVDYNIFAANVCLESMEKVMNKAINYNKDAIHPIIKISAETNITNTIDKTFIKYYTFLGSLFWLNVMCFDIWYTFRQLRSLQRNVKQQKRKKLIIYSVFAWGGPFILTIICSVVEFVPDFVSSDFQPNFENGCWFNDASETAYFLYYNDVGTISRIVTMCLCICTAHKIAIYEKDIAFRLKDSKGQRYNHNKQWFKLYLEAIKILFISYCIQWYMYIIQWYYNENPFMTRYVYFALDSTQHFCIFIIFVWKKKIRKLLLKRLGCQSRDMFSTECAIVSSNNSTTTSGMSSLCENTNPYANKKCHASSSFDSTAL